MICSYNGNGTAQAQAEALLKKVGLKVREEHLPREQSVGQHQRVVIVRVLVNSPDVILADEPAGKLDPTPSLSVLKILKRLNREEGRTVIMVTHSPEAATCGDRQVYLKDGKALD